MPSESPVEQYWRYRIVVSNPEVTAARSIVIEANPARIGLIVALAGDIMARILPSSALTINRGIKIKHDAPLPFEIRHRDYGALVGVAWYGIAADDTSLEVIETILEKYPVGA